MCMRVDIWIPDNKYEILKEMAELRDMSMSAFLVKSALKSRLGDVENDNE